MSSAKSRNTFGQVLSFVGTVLTGTQAFAPLGYGLILLGAGLQYSAARKAQKEADRRARALSERAEFHGNIRAPFKEHFMVFGRARAGGPVVVQSAHTPTPNNFVNQDLYIGVAHSICHPGGTEGLRNIWIDDTHIDESFLSDDANEAASTVSISEGSWNHIEFANGTYLAIGNGVGATSKDGKRWQKRVLPDQNWESAAYSESLNLWVIVATTGAKRVATSPDLVNWTLRSSTSDGHLWHTVEWSPDLGLFFAAGDNDPYSSTVAMTSTDGVTWTSRTVPQDLFRDVVWSPELSLFMATGLAGSGTGLATSPDGITWTQRTVPADHLGNGAAWSPSLGLFVSIGQQLLSTNGKCATSTDGITWTARTVPNEQWVSVAWSESSQVFVAGATGVATNHIATSPDGITWTQRTTPTAAGWTSVAAGDGGFLAVADSLTSAERLGRSPDGLNWSTHDIFPAQFNNTASNGVALRSHRGRGTAGADGYLRSRGLITVGEYRRGIAWTWARFRRPTSDADFSDTYRNVVPTLTAEIEGIRCYDPRKDSTEGGTDTVSQSWTTRTSAANNLWASVVYAPEIGLYAAVSSTGSGNRVMTSPDGITWTIRTSAANQTWTSIAWSPSLRLFAAVSRSGTTQRVMTSPDGITWTLRTTPNDDFTAITWSPEKQLFVAIGDGTSVFAMTSPDGITWTSRTLTNEQWNDVIWAGDLGLFVAVNDSGTSRVSTSPDGITWTARTAPTFGWQALAWSPELQLLAAVADTGTGTRVMTSPDGINWTSRTSAADNSWTDIVWNGRNFVAVATSGTGDRVMTSPDGINWTSRTSAADNSWTGLAVNRDTLVVAVGSSGTGNRVMTSPARDPMRHGDPYTWEWTDNPILHAATHSIMDRSDGGWGIPTDKIVWDSVIASANVCEETKSTPAGDRNLFVGNGVLTTADDLESNLQRILNACGGRRVKVGNKYEFHAASYIAPTHEIDDTWLAGGYTWHTLDPLDSLYNAVRVNFNDEDNDYRSVEAPPFTSSDYEAEDGGERLWRDLNLPMVSNTYDAQYLAQIEGKRSRYQATIDLFLNFRALDLKPWETVTIRSLPKIPKERLDGRVWRIEAMTRQSTGFAVTLREDHSSIYDVDEMQVPH